MREFKSFDWSMNSEYDVIGQFEIRVIVAGRCRQ